VDILVCTDGSNSSLQSADLIARLSFPTTSRITLLGVREKISDVEKLTSSMDMLEHRLGKKYTVTRKLRAGIPSEEILAEALEGPYDLVAVGGGGQLGLLHPKIGSTTSNLARRLHTHFLVSRNIPEQISKILICIGAESPSSETIPLGGAWIANTSAQVGLLHVTQAQKSASISGMKAEGSLKTEPAGRDAILEQASQQLMDTGNKNEIIPHLRQGLVVEEALKELSEGGYQLLVVGAHYQPGADRWQGALFDDITDQLLNRSTCSVLII